MARSGAFIGLVFMVAALAGGSCAMAATHVVGGSTGWVLPSASNGLNYTAWAAEQTFVVGDVLHFAYKNGTHNVQPMPDKVSFAACNKSAAIVPVLEGGSTDITLKTPGNKWYICAVGNHCEKEMKFKITVSAAMEAPAPAPTGETGAASTIAVSRVSALGIGAAALLLAFFH